MKFNFNHLKPHFILLFILFVAYLPLSTFYFGMKNDAFSDNFPDKFFLSEALHAGYFPLWNPYMNFGFPIYADPGFAYWNPVTWLFAFIGYNAYTLTFEVLLYIYIAGICMYYLCRSFKFKQNISICTAAMFMCCGFFTGCLQYINFITSAAFLPLLLMCFFKLFNKPCYINAFYCSICYYLVFCGGHPAIPVATAYFIIILFICLFAFEKSYREKFKSIITYNCLAVLLFSMYALPAFYSYYNIAGVYAKQHPDAANTGFSISSYISFIYPFVTVAKSIFFSNDIAMRNGYFSLAGFLCSLFFIDKKNKIQLVLLITAALMLLLSIGGDFKTLIYSKLPLLSYIRTNGEFRVFAILCLCISSAFAWQELSINILWQQRFKKLLIACVVISMVLSFYILFNKTLLISKLKKLDAGFIAIIKFVLNNITFSQALLISIHITILLSLLILLARKNRFNWLSLIIVADLIFNTIIYLPVTGIGRVSLPKIQSIYNTTPKGIPKPALIPVKSINTLDAAATGLVGDFTYYNKQVGTTKLTDYPSYFTSTAEYFDDTISKTVSSKPYLFLKSGLYSQERDNIQVINFTPSSIKLHVTATNDDTLVYLQNNYKFWNATVNNKPVKIYNTYKTFMAVPVIKGNNTIEFTYADHWLASLMGFSFLFFAVNLFFVIKINRRSFHNNQTGIAK